MSLFRAMPGALLCGVLFAAAPVSADARTASADRLSCSNSASRREAPTTVTAMLAGVPALLRIPGSIEKPPIILWHGFGPPASEQALMEALPLDEVPAVKVYLGLPLFGARAPAGGMQEIARRQGEDVASLVFEPAVMGAATELSAVVDALRTHECIGPHDAIGLFGFSAGGAALLIALAQRAVPIDAAVTLNASTGLSASIQAYERATKSSYSWTPATRKLASRSDAAARAADIARGDPPPALLIMHGADDSMLPQELAVTLHAALLPLYEKTHDENRARLEILPAASHGWTDGATVATVRALAADWFMRHH